MAHRLNKKSAGLTAAAALLALGTTGAAVGSGDDDATDTPITGEALERATTAALSATGGGTVTGTEVGDEESLYEVEVTLEDGRQVDVQLDVDFAVVGSVADQEAGGDR